ncbi:MAG: AmmeMemoRadiSam system radical SAM enzyme [Candidatus Thorarchaeota archaeon]
MKSHELKNLDPRVIRPGILQKQEKDGVRCFTCEHRCLLREQKTGICMTRLNDKGTIKTLVYGNVSSISNNPIEKKPFFHFAPSTFAYTVGSWGCNASCGFCQNYRISKQEPNPENAKYMSADEFVNLVQRKRAQGTSISFSEAATLMLEWNLEVFKLAREKGMYNTIVTNGYMSPEAIDLMVNAGLDAANVDVKGCEPEIQVECGIYLQPVLDNILHMIKAGIHVELTTLVVPGLSHSIDCLEIIASWIVRKTGKKTPWHINMYHPDYKYEKPPPSLSLLLEAREMARDNGMEFVYIGNVGGQGLEDTVCPNCGEINVERYLMSSKIQAVDEEGKCSNCGYNLAMIFQTGRRD